MRDLRCIFCGQSVVRYMFGDLHHVEAWRDEGHKPIAARDEPIGVDPVDVGATGDHPGRAWRPGTKSW